MGRKKQPDKMRIVCTKMPPSLIVALDRLARKLKGTRSELVRSVLIDHVANSARRDNFHG
jgi:metal-responsive CopG/Arc/MetJ family transcriptional regulator